MCTCRDCNAALASNLCLDCFYRNYERLRLLGLEIIGLGIAIGRPIANNVADQVRAKQINSIIEGLRLFRTDPDFPAQWPPAAATRNEIPTEVRDRVLDFLAVRKARVETRNGVRRIIEATPGATPAWREIMEGLNADATLWGSIKRMALEFVNGDTTRAADLSQEVSYKLTFTVMCRCSAWFDSYAANPDSYYSWRGALFRALTKTMYLRALEPRRDAPLQEDAAVSPRMDPRDYLAMQEQLQAVQAWLAEHPLEARVVSGRASSEPWQVIAAAVDLHVGRVRSTYSNAIQQLRLLVS